MIIFVHIPKAAGAYVRDKILRTNCNALTTREIFDKYISNKYLSECLLRKKKLSIKPEAVVGHIPYGIHRIFDVKESEVSYFTFLRDPVERWLSNFYYFQNEFYIRKPWNEYSRLFKSSNNDLKSFVKLCLKEGWTQNQMIRQISGSISDIVEIEKRSLNRRNNKLNRSVFRVVLLTTYEYINRLYLSYKYTKSFDTAFRVYAKNLKIKDKYKISILQKPLQIFSSFKINFKSRIKGFDDVTLDVFGYHLQSKVYNEEENKEFLERAKQNILKFDFVGYQDNMQQDIVKLCQFYKWTIQDQNKTYNKANYYRLKKIDLDNEILNMIRELNKYDIMFYEWCKRILQDE